ncbi:MAG: hypothetical protein KDA41_01355, partial [Planctomycetales bacterium]|nr:hypothetical protein [Planctomycetales bacterium]
MRMAVGLSLMLSLMFCMVGRADDEDKDRKGPPRGEDFRARLLEKFDENKDGKLDEKEREAARAEFHKRHGEGGPGPGPGGFDRKALMEKFDEDKSGDLNEKEKAALHKHFEEMRAKHGGQGGPGGRPALGGPGRPPFDRDAIIKEFDKDEDGKLDEKEREAAKAAMRERFEKLRAEGQGPRGEGKGPRGPRKPKPEGNE